MLGILTDQIPVPLGGVNGLRTLQARIQNHFSKSEIIIPILEMCVPNGNSLLWYWHLRNASCMWVGYQLRSCEANLRDTGVGVAFQAQLLKKAIRICGCAKPPRRPIQIPPTDRLDPAIFSRWVNCVQKTMMRLSMAYPLSLSILRSRPINKGFRLLMIA